VAYKSEDVAMEDVTLNRSGAKKSKRPGEPSADEYRGSRDSDKYHYPTCFSATSITDENGVIFSSVADAQAADYVVCGTCNPTGS
jgi:hypothetical protein